MTEIHSDHQMNHSAEWESMPPPTPFKQPGTHRIPNRIYSDADLHQREMEAFFYKRHWCYVALECEIPNAGDF